MNKDPSEMILEGSRFWFQKVLVPIMVCIGVTGNTITVMVLTRSKSCINSHLYNTLDANLTPKAYLLPNNTKDLSKGRRMRSSTNIYLSALAIADIIHLFFVFLLSFKHYNNIHDRRYELYWRFYGLSHWLCDAASSTSVWLTVSFTIERYIAVCHPMKGKYFCTENRAKTVTVIVYIFCLLTTASTTFEYQLNLNDTVTCTGYSSNKTCLNDTTSYTGFFTNSTMIHYVPNNIILTKQNYSENSRNIAAIKVFNDPTLTTNLKNILTNCTSRHSHIIYVYPQVLNVTHERRIPKSTKVETLSNLTILHQEASTLEKPSNNDSVRDVTLPEDDLSNENETSNGTNVTIKHCCNVTKLFIDVESTTLGKDENYTTVMYWYSALVFGIIPLLLIATFNCFLVRAVYLSQRKRRTLTNSKSHHNSQENVSVSHENRITMMLIAVVVMFLLCQTPTASYLIYYNFYPPATERERNIQNTLGNVFNFLLTVNASCNFLLYSIMSKKFRSTFKQLFFERGKNKRQDTIALSSTKSHNTQKFNPYHHGIKRNASEYHTPRNLETTSLTSVPRSKSLITRPVGKAKSTDLIV